MYVNSATRGLLGGLNIIGNPSQFVNEYRAGKSKGFFGLIGGVVAGTSNSLSKVIGVAGSGLCELSFD